MDFFGLDSIQNTGAEDLPSAFSFDQNDIANAFSQDVPDMFDSVTLIEPKSTVNFMDAARMAAEAAAVSSFAAISASVPVPKIPELFTDVPALPASAPIEKKVRVSKTVYGRKSKGTLKRKVIGDGTEFVSDISKTRRVMEFRKREECERFGDRSFQNQPNRKLKTRGHDTYVLGYNVHPSRVPSSASRRLCQVICAMGNWDRYGVFFTKIPDIIKSLKHLCEQEMRDNGLSVMEEVGSFLRATVQRSLCTEGKKEDYVFCPIARYILQEKYTSSASMSYKTIQSLCGSICKYNARIGSEFSELSYSKIGSSRVSNTLFNITK